MNTEGRKIYTVSELNREIKVILEDAYPAIWLEGEISNFRVYSSGHMYFSLKDAEAQVSAVMFQGMNRFLKFTPEDGLKVIARGRVSTYPKRGEYQLIVTSIEPAGKGALQLAFEQLKAKLEKEGLFDPRHKKPIPALPQKIGIVTSPTGAAIRDILTIIERRFANVGILIYPARVQGDEAKAEIASGIKYLNAHHPDIDVLLVGRGGGSYEDLWAFNEEIVARAIFESAIPVISCVGHEIDYTIADFVADLRAPTPSAAAELVVKNKFELVEKLTNLRQRLSQQMQFLITHYQQRITHAATSRALTRPQDIFAERMQEIDELLARLARAAAARMDSLEKDARRLAEKLHLLSPLSVLSRGYAICFDAVDNTVIKGIADVSAGAGVKVKLHDGEFVSDVKTVTRRNV
ncbi:MAG: exodeoxyribonuclease VII large subunit [Elusimicrobia bacterium RIFOXYA2_FULL_50_26]|nr:MAG: exodeoxyribonuclease VII large subunit [Elusimicrobia bacterium RIFOXYA2_FULL_50_26]